MAVNTNIGDEVEQKRKKAQDWYDALAKGFGIDTDGEDASKPAITPLDDKPFSSDRDLAEAYSVPGIAEHKNIDVQSYLDYTGSNINFLTDDVQQRRAEAQSTWGQLLGFANQSIVGEIVGGTIESFGYLLDVEEIADHMQGKEADWGNWLSDIGKGIREWTQESTPIYQEEPGTFNPGDPAWWFANGVSIFSTISLMIPSGAFMKGAGMLAKGVSRGARFIDKSLDIASQMSRGGKALTAGTTQALFSRYAESMMEATNEWKQEYDKQIADGVSEDFAKMKAGEVASSVFNWNTGMLASDILQYTILHRGAKFARGKKQDIIEGANLTGMSRGVGGALATQFVTEGAEEAYQYVVAEEAKHKADVASGVRPESTFSERMGDYWRDGEMWTHAFFGGLGGLAFTAVGKAVKDRLADKSPGFNRDPINAIHQYSQLASLYSQKIKAAEDEGLFEQAENLRMNMAVAMSVFNAERETGQDNINMLEAFSEMSQEDVELYNEQTGANLDYDAIQRFGKRYTETAKSVQDLYQKNLDKYGKEYAGAITKREALSGVYSQRKSDIQDKVDEAVSAVPKVEELSPSGRGIFDLQNRVGGLKLAKQELEFAKKQFKDEEVASDFQKAIDNIDSQLSIAEQNLKKEQQKEYDSQDKANDKQILSDIDQYREDIVSREADFHMADQMINVNKRQASRLAKEAKDEDLKQQKREAAEAKKRARDKVVETQDVEGVEDLQDGDTVQFNDVVGTFRTYKKRDGSTGYSIEVEDGENYPNLTPEALKRVNKVTTTEDKATQKRKQKEDEQIRKDSEEAEGEVIRTFSSKDQAESTTKSHQASEKPVEPVEDSPTNQGDQTLTEDLQSAPEGVSMTFRSYKNLQERKKLEQQGGLGLQVAQTLTQFIDNPNIPLTDQSGDPLYYVEPIIDHEWMDSNPKVFTEIQQKIRDDKKLTQAEINKLPIILEFKTLGGEQVQIGNNDVFSWLQTENNIEKKAREGRITSEEASRQKQNLAKTRQQIYQGIKGGNPPVSYITGQNTGFVQNDPNVEQGNWDTYNSIPEAFGLATEEIEFAIRNSEGRYTDASGNLHDDLRNLQNRDPEGSGDLFFVYPAANGENVAIQATRTTLTEEEAEIVYAIYKSMVTGTNPSTAVLDSIKRWIRAEEREDRTRAIDEVIDLDNITMGDKGSLLKFLVFEGESTKTAGDSRLYADLAGANSILHFGESQINRQEFKNDTKKSDFISWITSTRYRQTDRNRLDDPGYKRYLVDSRIVVTNANVFEDQYPIAQANLHLSEFTDADQSKFEYTVDNRSAEVREEKQERSNRPKLSTEDKVTIRETLDQIIESGVSADQILSEISRLSELFAQHERITPGDLEGIIQDPDSPQQQRFSELVTQNPKDPLNYLYLQTKARVESKQHPADQVEDVEEKRKKFNQKRQQKSEEEERPPWENTEGGPVFQIRTLSQRRNLSKDFTVRGLTRTLDDLENRFGITYQVIDSSEVGWAGKYSNGTSIINLAYATRDTPYHEYAHPMINTIKMHNRELYNRLVEEIQNSSQGQIVYQSVLATRPDLGYEQLYDESMVQLLGEYASGTIAPQDRGLRYWLGRLWNSIKRLMRDIFGVNLSPVDLSRLDPSTTLGELSLMLEGANPIEVVTTNTSHYQGIHKGEGEFFTQAEISNITDGLTALLINRSGIEDINDVNNLDLRVIPQSLWWLSTSLPENHPLQDSYFKILDDILDENFENLDENSKFLRLVQDKLKTFGIVPSQEVRFEDRDERVNIQSPYEFSAKSKATAAIRLLVGTVPKLNSGNLVENIFGESQPDYVINEATGFPEFYSLTEMWNAITEITEGVVPVRDSQTGKVEDGYRLFIDRLKENVEFRPELQIVIDRLEKAPEQRQTQFFIAFSKVNHNFSGTYLRRDRRGFHYNIGRADTQSKVDQIIDGWEASFFSKLGNLEYLEDSTRLDINKKKGKQLVQRYRDLESKTIEVLRDKKAEITDSMYSELQSILNEMGIEISQRGLRKFVASQKGDSRKQKFDNAIRQKDAGIQYLFEGGDLSLDFLSKSDTKLDFEKGENVLNPLTSEKVTRQLARAEGYFRQDLSDDNFLGPGGNNYYTYSDYSPMTVRVNQWRRDASYLESLTEVAGYTNSRWANWLLEDADNRENFQVQNFKLFTQEFTGDQGTKNDQLSTSDYLADRVNRTLKGIFTFPARADSTTEYVIKGPPLFTTSDGAQTSVKLTQDGKITLNGEATSLIIGYLIDELSRIKGVRKELDVLPQKDWVEHHHYSYKEDLSEQQLERREELKDEEGNPLRIAGREVVEGNGVEISLIPDLNNPEHGLFDKNTGEPITPTRENTYNNSQLRGKIKKWFSGRVDQEMEALWKDRVLKKKDGTYQNNSIDVEILQPYRRKYRNNSIRAIVYDYLFNGMIGNIEFHKLFGGDVSLYKNRDDFQKRAGGPGVLGLPHRILPDMTSNYVSAVVEDIIKPSEVYSDPDQIKAIAEYTGETQKKVKSDLAEHIKGVNEADAQAWITIDQYRDRMRGYGKWSEAHQEAYQRIKNNEALPEDLGLFMQSLKTAHVELRIDNGRVVFHYNKHSEAVLHPWIAEQTNLGNLLRAMENQIVDYVVVSSGKKVGASGITNPYDEDGSFKDPSQIRLNPVALDKQFTFLQQELSYKGMTPTLEASQVRKNMIGSIDPSSELYRQINDVTSALSNKHKQILQKRLGWNGTTIDQNKYYNLLKEAFTQREVDLGVLKALQLQLPVDGVPQIRKQIEHQEASLVNEATVKLKHTTGGGYIQMTDVGFVPSVEEIPTGVREGITWLKREELKPQRMEEGEPKPAQLLLPHKILNQIPNVDNLSQSELQELIGEDIMAGISYRIPNQDITSNDVVEVIGFLPQEMGDTVVGYGETTTKFGSDFDFDKLTVMLPNYKLVDGKPEKVKFWDIDTSDEDQLSRVYDYQFDPVKRLREEMNSQYFGDLISFLKEEKLYRLFRDQLVETAPEGVKLEELRGLMELAGVDRTVMEEMNSAFEKIPTRQQWINSMKGESIYQINSIAALENRKLELYQQAIQSPEAFLNNIKALETDFLKNLIEQTAPTQEQYSAFEAYSPTTQAHIRKLFVDTNSAVGQIANHITDHNLSMGNRVHLRTYNQDGILVPYNTGFGNTVEIERGKATKLSGDTSQDGRNIISTMSMFLTANFDAANDPYITRGNFNLTTNDVAMLMLRAETPVKQVVDFMNQPIIRDYADIVDRYQGRTSFKHTIEDPKTGQPRQLSEVEYMVWKYSGNSTWSMRAAGVAKYGIEDIKEEISSEETNDHRQLAVLQKFLDMQKAARILTQSHRVSKSDVNGGGRSLIEANMLQALREEISRQGLIGGFDNKFSNTFLGTMTDNSVGLLQEMFGDKHINQSSAVQSLMRQIFQQTRDTDYAPVELAEAVSDQIYAHIMSGSPLAVSKEKLQEMFSGSNSMAKRLRSLKFDDRTRDNPLIQHLGYNLTQEENYDFIYTLNKNIDTSERNALRSAWLELYESEDSDVSSFARDLVSYSFYNSGFTRNLTSFYELIPVEVTVDMGIDQYIIETTQRLSDNPASLDSAIGQIYKNMSDDNRIVPNIRWSTDRVPVLGKRKGTRYIFGVDSTDEAIRVDNGNQDYMKFKPYVKVDDNLYKYRGLQQREGKNPLAIYSTISNLGLQKGRFRVREYYFEEGDTASVFEENNVGKVEEVENFLNKIVQTNPGIDIQTKQNAGQPDPNLQRIKSELEQIRFKNNLSGEWVDKQLQAWANLGEEGFESVDKFLEYARSCI